jgi:hypothetical protein
MKEWIIILTIVVNNRELMIFKIVEARTAAERKLTAQKFE